MKNLTTERTRRTIGRRVEHCPFCDRPLSFRDNVPFCRKCALFGKAIVDGKKAQITETHNVMEGRR